MSTTATDVTEQGDILDPGAQPEETAEAVEQDHDEADTDEEHNDIGRARAQAKKYRARLRETEAERDQIREQLAAQQRAFIDWRATTSADGPVDPQLLDAAGLTVSELVDGDGHLNMNAVDTFIDQTATRFRVHRSVKPNPQQGAPSQAPAPPRLADAFKPAKGHR